MDDSIRPRNPYPRGPFVARQGTRPSRLAPRSSCRRSSEPSFPSRPSPRAIASRSGVRRLDRHTHTRTHGRKHVIRPRTMPPSLPVTRSSRTAWDVRTSTRTPKPRATVPAPCSTRSFACESCHHDAGLASTRERANCVRRAADRRTIGRRGELVVCVARVGIGIRGAGHFQTPAHAAQLRPHRRAERVRGRSRHRSPPISKPVRTDAQ